MQQAKQSLLSKRLKTLQGVWILPLMMLALTSCSGSSVYIKPDGALTVPMDKAELSEGDTFRDLVEKFLLRGNAIDEGNLRFKAIRE